MVTVSLSQLVTTGTLTCLPCQLIIRPAELLRIRQFTCTLAPAKWNLHVTSLDKIRQTIDEVVAQVLLTQAEQLRNEVSEKIRPYLDEDSKHLEAIQAELKEHAEKAKELEQQLVQTRSGITEKHQQIEAVQKQLTSAVAEHGEAKQKARKAEEELHGKIAELENSLKAESERLAKQAQELEQLLEISQEEVRQLQGRENELKANFKGLEKQIEDLQVQMREALGKKDEEHEKILSEKERLFSDKTADYEQRLQAGSKTTADAIEAVRRESAEALQSKERELLDQVHLLEELLVQGQHAREQQLDAKDRELHGALETQKVEFESRISELQAQLADRDKVIHQQGGELQQRVVGLEGELSGSQKQVTSLQKELQDTQAAFEKTQQQLDDLTVASRKREEELALQLKERQEAVFMTERSLKDDLEKQLKAREELLRSEFEERQGSDFETTKNTWDQREKELTAQLSGLEKRVADYAVAEQAWQQREQELLGHRDKVLDSSAQASEASQKALQSALEDQARLQTQLDAMIDELGRVREELQQAQSSLAAKGGAVSSAPAKTRDEATAVKTALDEIHAAHSQSEILKALLEHVSTFADRTGILVIHGHAAAGWGARGFNSEADFRKLNVECSAGAAGRVMQGKAKVSCKATDFEPKLVKQFGAPAEGQATVFPLVVRDRVVAFLYTDCGTDSHHELPQDAIDSIVRAAGAKLDELAKNKKTAPNAPAQPPAPAASAAAVVAEEAQPVMAMGAAAGVAAGGATREAPGTNADVARQRARRFAKLLVDEIKLYNKDAVDVGRKNADLYDRLREPIDKSRASYEKRWGKTITDVDYFREELVRNLAENNVDVLGTNFPR